jgi:hypothetical protein
MKFQPMDSHRIIMKKEEEEGERKRKKKEANRTQKGC